MVESTILLVEDNPDDVVLIERALKKARILNPLRVLDDGEKAIAYLAGYKPHDDRTEHPLPILVLLDLKLPRRTGFEVLEWRRDNMEGGSIPFVVLTTSKDSMDVNKAFDLGADSYLVKPVGFEDLVYLVDKIELGWLLVAHDKGPGKT
jgi:CheY-like chemotaxis protein